MTNLPSKTRHLKQRSAKSHRSGFHLRAFRLRERPGFPDSLDLITADAILAYIGFGDSIADTVVSASGLGDLADIEDAAA